MHPGRTRGNDGIYYLRKRVGRILRIIRGRPRHPRRYDHIYDEITRLRPKNILEIGTNDGIHAARMARAAQTAGIVVDYYGFDLFEHQRQDQFLAEFSLRTRSRRQVERYLRRHGVASARLYAGDSTVTLPQELARLPPMDLVFIDGGHSLATVASDWENVQRCLAPAGVVFFDDYPNWGIRPVVDAIDRSSWEVDVMPAKDRYKVPPEMSEAPDGWMTFQVVRVRRRR